MEDSAVKAYIEKYKDKFDRAMIEKQLMNYGATKEQIAKFYSGEGVLKPVESKDMSSQSSDLGGFWMRVLATFVDYLIINMIAIIILTPYMLNPTESLVAFVVAGFAFIILGPLLYFPLMHASKHQATLGKLILNLKVVDMNHSKISYGRAFGRVFMKTINWMIPFAIGFIIAAFTQKKQTVHDMVAKTLVITTGPVKTWILSLTIVMCILINIALSYFIFLAYAILFSQALTLGG